MNTGLLGQPSTLPFEHVQQLLAAKEYSLALEALFQVDIESPEVQTVWYKIFREIKSHTLSHVVALLLGREMRDKCLAHRGKYITHYCTLLSIMNPGSDRGMQVAFSKDDYKIIADLIGDRMSRFRALKIPEAYQLAWVVKAGELTGENSPFINNAENERLVSVYLPQVKFKE